MCWTIYLAEKSFCFLNGAVTKNRTLTKPSCQVRRLSKLKSACLIYLYSFACSAARRVPSFVEAWLCYAHRCTFLALFPLPSPRHGILNRRMQSPGKWRTWKVSHAETTMFDALMALGDEESTAHVKGGSRRFRLIDTVIDNFARCQTKIIGACMYDWTCSSSSKPPAIAVHVLTETPRPASRQLVQGVSVVNKSANMPLI